MKPINLLAAVLLFAAPAAAQKGFSTRNGVVTARGYNGPGTGLTDVTASHAAPGLSITSPTFDSSGGSDSFALWDTAWFIYAYSADSEASLAFRAIGGTAVSSAAITEGTVIGGYRAKGYDGVHDVDTIASKNLALQYADEDWSDGNDPSNFAITTNKPNKTGNNGRRTHAVVTSSGAVVLGEWSAGGVPTRLEPVAQLDVRTQATEFGNMSIAADGQIVAGSSVTASGLEVGGGATSLSYCNDGGSFDGWLFHGVVTSSCAVMVPVSIKTE